MATVTGESAGKGCFSEVRDEDLAVQRVAAYFHGLGLPTENALAWARRIVHDAHGVNGDVADEGTDAAGGYCGRAMERAMHRVDDWFEWLAASCPHPSDDLTAQLQWYLRPVLRNHPECFLQTDALPGDLQRAVREAARPILPPSIPAVMPAQSFGDLPHLGHRIVAYGSLMGRRLVNALWRIGK